MRACHFGVVSAAIVACAVACASAGGCSSFTENEPSEDAAAEGGQPGDAGGPGDGALDGDASGDAAVRCRDRVPKPLLCLDFDDGPTINGFEHVGAGAAIDPAYSVSPPGSLRVIGDDTEASMLRRVFPTSYGTYTLDFAVRVGGEDGGPPLGDFTIPVRLATAACVFDLIARNGGALDVGVRDAGATLPDRPTFIQKLGLGAWTRVQITLSNGPVNVRARVLVDGVEAIAERDTKCPTLGGGAELIVGMMYGKGITARFDDFVFDGK